MFYEEVYIIKPLLSRESNSEKYIVCKGFKKNERNIEILLNILKQWEEKEQLFLFDFFPEYE